MKTLNSSEIAQKVAQATGQPIATCINLVEAAVSTMRDEIVAGNKIVLDKFISLQRMPSGAMDARLEFTAADGPATSLSGRSRLPSSGGYLGANAAPAAPKVDAPATPAAAPAPAPAPTPAPTPVAPAPVATPAPVSVPEPVASLDPLDAIDAAFDEEEVIFDPTAPAAAPVAVAPEPAAPAAQTALTALENKLLFVVPMKDFFVDIIAGRLAEGGRQVEVAEGSDKALERFAEFKPAVTIVDGNLPDAEKVIRGIKLDRDSGVTSLVVIYPEGHDPSQIKGLHVCEDEAILEPYEIDDLVTVSNSEYKRVCEERDYFQQEVHFQFQTAETWIEQANDLMGMLVDSSNVDDEVAAALSVGFREGVDNGARHGNKSQESRLIDAIYLLDSQKITITVEDEGDGFDTEMYLTRGIQGNAVAAARERNQAGRVGGLGIMLMLKCLDDLEYNRVGNLVKLTKYR